MTFHCLVLACLHITSNTCSWCWLASHRRHKSNDPGNWTDIKNDAHLLTHISVCFSIHLFVCLYFLIELSVQLHLHRNDRYLIHSINWLHSLLMYFNNVLWPKKQRNFVFVGKVQAIFVQFYAVNGLVCNLWEIIKTKQEKQIVFFVAITCIRVKWNEWTKGHRPHSRRRLPFYSVSRNLMFE